MRAAQALWTSDGGWKVEGAVAGGPPPSLVLCFGDREALTQGKALEALAKHFPPEVTVGCSTSGEVAGEQVHSQTVVATAIWFDKATVRISFQKRHGEFSEALGKRLASAVPHEGLVHVLVLSDGIHINGSDLVRGMADALPAGVGLSGGLAGDDVAFKETVVCCQGQSQSDSVVVVGFYGEGLTVRSASKGGWDAFGPTRTITRSSANVLYELDGEPALALYKRYLGEAHSQQLPGSALLFPLTVWVKGQTEPVVRTILGVDEATGSMTFAGNMPQGAQCQLMRAQLDRVVGAAEGAAESTCEGASPDLAILISCVGRKVILKQRVEEEIEAVRNVYGPNTALAGFYSYGEIAPFQAAQAVELHNQTMTITAFSER